MNDTNRFKTPYQTEEITKANPMSSMTPAGEPRDADKARGLFCIMVVIWT